MKIIILLLVLALSSSYAADDFVGGYTQLSAADIKNDPDIKPLADYGAQQVVLQARADQKLAKNNKDTFKVSTINSVATQVVSGMNYKFDVKIVNSDGSIVINAKYVVYDEPWTNTREVTIISYDVVKKKVSGVKKN